MPGAIQKFYQDLDFDKTKLYNFPVEDVAGVISGSSFLSSYGGSRNELCTLSGARFTRLTSNAAVDNIITFSVSGSATQRWVLKLSDNHINVRDFGAKGDGINNDLVPIQNAINYARNQTAGNGGVKRMQVLFPSGVYRLNATGSVGIDITNANGVSLVGAGKYVSTTINGNCGGAIFDFTGATMSGCTGFTFLSDKNEGNPAKIGVQFGLSYDGNGNQLGGLNSFIKDCYFQMDHNPTFNGGFGTIGIFNCRAEEFHMENILSRANTPVMFTNMNAVNINNTSYTFTSPYATLATGVGSMGVISAFGMSLQGVDNVQSPLILNGVNGLNFSGYIHGGIGTYKAAKDTPAIFVQQRAMGLRFTGTVEGCPQVLYNAGQFDNCEIIMSYANINGVVDKPVIKLAEGAGIRASKIAITFGNGQPEIGNRSFISCDDVNSGDSPTTCYIQNTELSSPGWPDNATFVKYSLLKNASNTKFVTGQPFDKLLNAVIDRKTNTVILGNTSGSVDITGDLIRFTKADKVTKTAGNGGYYQVSVKGTVSGGTYYSGGPVATQFSGEILLNQTQEGISNTIDSKVIIINQVGTNNSYLAINDLTLTLDTSNAFFISVRLTVKNSGTANGEQLIFNGQVEVTSNFLVNQSVIFA